MSPVLMRAAGASAAMVGPLAWLLPPARARAALAWAAAICALLLSAAAGSPLTAAELWLSAMMLATLGTGATAWGLVLSRAAVAPGRPTRPSPTNRAES